jgi:hypothetical protein
MKNPIISYLLFILLLLTAFQAQSQQQLVQIIDENGPAKAPDQEPIRVLAPITETGSNLTDFTLDENDPKANSSGNGLSLLAIPANNNCANATALTINAPCVNGTNKEATVQSGENYACQGTPTKTVWYKFVASQANMFVEVERTASSGCYLSSAVYSGNCLPASATAISCEDAAGGPNLNIHNLTGLTVNSTYLIQVSYRGGTGCGNNSSTSTGADFCIRVGTPTICATCGNNCGSVCVFPTTPTVTQVTTNCAQYNLNPRLNAGQSNTQCYTFNAVAANFSLQMIINATGCGMTGNVTAFNWSLYPANCNTPVQSGNLTNLNANGLTMGANYTLCYNWTAACQHNSVYPYIIATSPLPVNLIHFDGDQSYSTVSLNWMTASELNNAYFSVQRSADGKDFTEIGKVHGKGTTSAVNKYKYIDRTPNPGISYYRLIQYDYDNTATPSKIIAVKFREAFNVAIGTNPVETEVQLQINTVKNTELTVFVYNPQGEEVLQQKLPSVSSSEKQTVPVHKLPAGSYIMKVTDTAETVYWLRFVKI